jgi:hypothetical protein
MRGQLRAVIGVDTKSEVHLVKEMNNRQDIAYGIEKFNTNDLTVLRNELLRSGVDSFQAADIVANFLTGRGYGCSTHEARNAASKIEVCGSRAEHIQAALELAARVM